MDRQSDERTYQTIDIQTGKSEDNLTISRMGGGVVDGHFNTVGQTDRQTLHLIIGIEITFLIIGQNKRTDK